MLYNKTKLLYNLNIDDSNLINELRNIGFFTYMPNSGNIGDMLIASATMNWFDKNKLKWKRAKRKKYPDNFVYGGGGAWTNDYIDGLKPVMNIMQHAKHVVVLPSSFNNVPEFIKILDERFVVFCREKKSFDYLISQKTKAKIILDHDMGLRMYKYSTNISWRYKRRNKELQKYLSHFSNEIKLFRCDVESLKNRKSDLDLSDYFGWFSSYKSRLTINTMANIMLQSLERFNIVHTDRLHVAIAGILLHKHVVMYDNSYGKSSAVYKHSLCKLPNVGFKI